MGELKDVSPSLGATMDCRNFCRLSSACCHNCSWLYCGALESSWHRCDLIIRFREFYFALSSSRDRRLRCAGRTTKGCGIGALDIIISPRCSSSCTIRTLDGKHSRSWLHGRWRGICLFCGKNGFARRSQDQSRLQPKSIKGPQHQVSTSTIKQRIRRSLPPASRPNKLPISWSKQPTNLRIKE